MRKEVFRPRLNEWELMTLCRLIDDEYRMNRRILRLRKKHHDDLPVHPIAEQEEYLKKLRRLLKKLNRMLHGKYAINP
jgi:hypothetical protein